MVLNDEVDRKRADIVASCRVYGTSYILDNTTVHPFSASLHTKAMSKPLASAETREAYKRDKYAQHTSDAGATFVPFVLESTGGFGHLALQFLQMLRHNIEMYQGIPNASLIVKTLQRRLSCLHLKAYIDRAVDFVRDNSMGPNSQADTDEPG